MKAAVYYGPEDVRIEDVPKPQAGSGEIVVRMLACGICGSDLMDWYTSQKAPVVLGHEPVGVVTEAGGAGDGDGRLPQPGARVFVHHHVPCMECELCRRGHQTLCPTFKSSMIDPGGFAEFIRVPAENVRLDVLELPAELSTEAATLIEPLACCIRSQRLAGVAEGSRIAIVGAGQMGLLQVQAAVAAGCSSVLAIEPLIERRSLAEDYGATACAPEAAPELAAAARPHIVIVCTGARTAFELGLSIVDDGGVVQLFAPTTPGRRFEFDPTDVFFREITMQASYSAGPRDTRAALDLLVSGEVTADDMITHRFALGEIAAALEVARSGDGIKVIVEGT